VKTVGSGKTIHYRKKKTHSSSSSKPARLRDVAREAGVSVATVSLVLSRAEGCERISKPTQDRVVDAAERLDYHTHCLARGLRLQHSMQVGLVIPNIFHPYMPPLIRGVGDVVRSNGYNLILLDMSTSDAGEAEECVSTLRGGGIDGLIIQGMADEFGPSLKNLPVVYIDEYRVAPVVRFDAEKAGYELTQHLIHEGHRNIGFIGSDVQRDTFVMRQRGYEKALTDAGIERNADFMCEVSVNVEGGIRAAQWITSFEQPPSAVVVCTDAIALGLLPSLHRLGVRIPLDIAVASIDDVELAALTMPPLTCIHVPAYEIGSCAAKMLLRILRGTQLNHEVNIVPTPLIIRESSRQVNQDSGKEGI
jgi:LacI family transcriptional regulator